MRALFEAELLVQFTGPITRMLRGADELGLRVTGHRLVGAALLAFLVTANSVQIIAQPLAADATVDFDIPAQPLSRALVAYSAATGLDVFYNAALAEKQRSGHVAGPMTAAAALRELLRETGYVAKLTGPATFTIAPATHEGSASRVMSATMRRQFEPYFATLQRGISDALCRRSGSASDGREQVFRFWLSTSGTIERVDVVIGNGDRAEDQSLAAPIRGLALPAPPASLPQPINMVIFPPSDRTGSCTVAPSQHRAG